MSKFGGFIFFPYLCFKINNMANDKLRHKLAKIRTILSLLLTFLTITGIIYVFSTVAYLDFNPKHCEYLRDPFFRVVVLFVMCFGTFYYRIIISDND